MIIVRTHKVIKLLKKPSQNTIQVCTRVTREQKVTEVQVVRLRFFDSYFCKSVHNEN